MWINLLGLKQKLEKRYLERISQQRKIDQFTNLFSQAHIFHFPFIPGLFLLHCSFMKNMSIFEDWKVSFIKTWKKYSQIITFLPFILKIFSIFPVDHAQSVSIMIRMKKNLWRHLTFMIFFKLGLKISE